MTTLSQLINQCRQRYNAVGDKFFADSELYNLIYEAEMELAQETEYIEEIYTTSTVASQREYDYPSRMLRPLRITYNGERLEPIDFLEDDAITGQDEATSSTGDPKYYAIFADRLFLRPLPQEVGTLKIYAIVQPSQYTATTDSITSPERYRPALIDYVLGQMFAKDKNSGMVSYHEGRWQRAKDRIKRFEMKRKIGDSIKVVKDIDNLPIIEQEPWR